MTERNLSRDISIAAAKYIKERDYWLENLSGELSKFSFAVDRKRKSAEGEKEKDFVTFELKGELFSKLMKLSNRFDYTLHMILLASLVILLDKYTYSSNKDIIVGIPIYKQQVDREFVNLVLPIRIRLMDHTPFKELLLHVRETVIQADKNKNYPFEALLELLNLPFSPHDCPLFDTALLLENIHDRSYLSPVDPNVVFIFNRRDTQVDGQVEYNAGMYEKSTIERLVIHFTRVLHQVLFNIHLPLFAIEFTTEEERRQLLVDFNRAGMEDRYQKDKTVHQLFEEQAERTPDNIALHGCMIAWLHGEGVSITYKELNEKANQLAQVLREKDVQTDTIVGIMVERSIEMIIGILGILKAGGAYLPIDPDCPAERLAYMLVDSSAKVLVTTCTLAKEVEKLRNWEGKRNIETAFLDYSEFSNFSSSHLLTFSSSHPSSLAYVIYTSGSTGNPKGVMVGHRNVIAYLNAFYNEFKISSSDIVIQQASYTFDAFVEEVYPILLEGGQLAITGKNEVMDFNLLSEFITKNNVKIISCSPLMLNGLNQLDNPGTIRGINTFISGGDELKRGYIDNLLNIGQVYNTYGPTEMTVCVTYYKCSDLDEFNIPIGKPISNYKVYILDRYNKLLPIGVSGEVIVSGDGVTRGYLNRQELTGEKFVENLFEPGQRMYKTGDLARWLSDGNIEFSGRIDLQVKIRGFRIELGEIENQLLNHEDIKEAVVVASEDGNGDKFLCAYIVGSRVFNQTAQNSQLRGYLSNTLPGYMIPSFFILMDKIPLTPGGKVDRRALPEPEITGNGSEFAAPRDMVEEKLVKIWSDVLLINEHRISIDDNFFNLGGHSLKATILISKIHKAFNVKVPLAEIFKKPTIRGLSQYIEAEEKDQYVSIKKAEEKQYYPLSSAQKRLYLLQQIDLEGTAYNMPVTVILEGVLEKVKLEDTFKKIIHRHESLRTSFHMIADEPVQKIHEEVEFEMEYYDLNRTQFEDKVGVEKSEGTGGLAPLPIEPAVLSPQPLTVLIDSFIHPFDLAQAPLLRVGLVPLEEEKHILMVDMHHIIADGLSMNILVREFGALYKGEEFPQLILQYKDFSVWQNNRIKSGEMKRHEEFWLELFKGEIPLLNLPIDFKRPDVLSFEGSTVVFETDKEVTAGVIDLVSELQVTLNILLLAACYVLLSKYTGQDDIVVGIPVSGRTHTDLENIIGFFSNMLAMRNRPREDKTFSQFVREIKENSVRAYENQDYQFEELVNRLGIQRESGRHPLVDTVFVLHNTGEQYGEDTRLRLGNLRIKPYEMERKVSHFDLLIHTYYANDVITLAIEYSNTLFKHSTIERMGKRYIDILEQVVENKELKLKEIKSPHELLAAKANIFNDIREDWDIHPGSIKVEG